MKESAPGGSEFFALRAVPYSMEITLPHLVTLNVTIFITHVRNCVMGATPMNTIFWHSKG